MFVPHFFLFNDVKINRYKLDQKKKTPIIALTLKVCKKKPKLPQQIVLDEFRPKKTLLSD